MSKQLVKAILDTEFYTKNEHRIKDELFPASIRPLVSTIRQAHKEFPTTTLLTRDELWELHTSWNPTITTARKQELEAVVDEIDAMPPMSSEIAEACLAAAWKEEMCREVANIALEIAEGQHSDWAKIEDAVEQARQGYEKDMVTEYVTTDATQLISTLRNKNPWNWNYPPLQHQLGPIGGGNFVVLAARPDCGKTAFWISLTFGKEGWLEQGAKVHVICNEEPAHRVMARGIAANTGIPIERMASEMSQVKERFAKVQDNIFMMDKVEMGLEELDQYLGDNEVNILILDQLDKIRITGQHARDDIRLKELYVHSRELAKRHDVPIIGVSQAGYEAHGKMYYGFESLDGSKTGKAAEADVVLCIGMPSLESMGGEDDGKRMINIPKNKLTGMKKAVPYFLDHRLSTIKEKADE